VLALQEQVGRSLGGILAEESMWSRTSSRPTASSSCSLYLSIGDTAASLLAHSAQRQDGGALDEARSILRAILADGPVAAHLVRKQARQAGLGPSIMWRAKAALGVRSRKLGQPGQSDQGWTWELPNRPERPPSS
jgi:hypothetical protein